MNSLNKLNRLNSLNRINSSGSSSPNWTQLNLLFDASVSQAAQITIGGITGQPQLAISWGDGVVSLVTMDNATHQYNHTYLGIGIYSINIINPSNIYKFQNTNPTVNLTNGKVIVNTIQDWISSVVDLNLTIRSVKMNIVNANNLIYAAFALSASSKIDISYSTINITALGYGFIQLETGSFKDVIFKNNNLVNNSNINLFINRGGSSWDVENNIFDIVGTGSGISLVKQTATHSNWTIKGNTVIQLASVSGYGIVVGAEDTSIADNTIDVLTLSDNKLVGIRSIIPASGAPHGIMAGFQATEVHITYNFINGHGSSLIFKGDNSDYKGGEIRGNIAINGTYGVVLAGANNATINNNTIINSYGAILIYAVTGGNGAVGNIIKNNIVVGASNYLITLDSDSLVNTFDYNIYYSTVAKPFFVAGVAKTFAEWQALGYDAHSIFLTAGQFANLFNDSANGDYSLKAGSLAIGAGIGLGLNLGYGLNPSTIWGSNSRLPVVVTKQQGGVYDIGAYVSGIVSGTNPNGSPSLLGLTVISDSEIDLAYTKGSTNEDGFSIERSPDGATWTEVKATLPAIGSYNNIGLTGLTLYYYRVRAFKGGLYSSYSNVVSATTQSSIPAIPTGLTATLISGGVKWDWTAGDPSAQTEVWCKNDSDAYTTATYTIAAGLVTKSETTAAVDLRYCKIRSLKNGHYSAFTDEVSIAMLGAELVNQTAWKTSPGATFWNQYFDPNWSADGVKLTSTGAGYLAGLVWYYLTAGTYRSIQTQVGTGNLTEPSDGYNDVYHNGSGTFISYRAIGVNKLYDIYSASFVGTLTFLSTKKVLMP